MEGSPLPTTEGSKEWRGGHPSPPSRQPPLASSATQLLTWPEPEVPSEAPQRHFGYCTLTKQAGFVACGRKGAKLGDPGETGGSDGKKAPLLCFCMPFCGSSYLRDLRECTQGEISIAKEFFTDPTTNETEDWGFIRQFLIFPKYQLSPG